MLLFGFHYYPKNLGTLLFWLHVPFTSASWRMLFGCLFYRFLFLSLFVAGKSKSLHVSSTTGFVVTSSPEQTLAASTPSPQNIVFKVGGQMKVSPPPPPQPHNAPPHINIALDSSQQSHTVTSQAAAQRPDVGPPRPPPKPTAAKTAAAAAAQSAKDYEVLMTSRRARFRVGSWLLVYIPTWPLLILKHQHL